MDESVKPDGILTPNTVPAAEKRYARQYGMASPLQARLRALLAGGRLPPGNLEGLDVVEKYQRAVLLHQAAQHGPIFKVSAYGKFWVCVIGLALGRKLLREHGESMTPVTIDVEAMVPAGFMRQMSGETHSKYRTSLARAIAREDSNRSYAALESIATGHLRRYLERQSTNVNLASVYKRTLEAIVCGMLIHIVFGAKPGTEFFETLMRKFEELGPHGSSWTQGERQMRAFAAIRRTVLDQLAASSGDGRHESAGLAHRLFAQDELDDTMLGNLILMVEMGRDDAAGLFRWLSRYACRRPDWMCAIGAEQPSDSPDPYAGSRAAALVLETLRSDQSSRLLRIVDKNIAFEQYLLPKNTLLRICLWESHRAESVFERPFEYMPERFIDRHYRADEFSPFGLDRHHCPFSAMTLLIGCAFLRALARDFELSAIDDGEPSKGPYFWEPAINFAVTLRARDSNRIH